MSNYRLRTAFFHPYQAGAVLPDFAFTARGHDPEALVKVGFVEVTNDRPTAEIEIPRASASADVSTAVLAELKETKVALARVTAERDLLSGDRDRLKESESAFQSRTLSLVKEVADLTADRDQARNQLAFAEKKLIDAVAECDHHKRQASEAEGRARASAAEATELRTAVETLTAPSTKKKTPAAV